MLCLKLTCPVLDNQVTYEANTCTMALQLNETSLLRLSPLKPIINHLNKGQDEAKMNFKLMCV